MDKDVLGPLLVIVMIVSNILWWMKSKGYPYRKYILLSGICWIVTVIAYILAYQFHMGQFLPVIIIAFILCMGFGIKAAFAERKFKKNINS